MGSPLLWAGGSGSGCLGLVRRLAEELATKWGGGGRWLGLRRHTPQDLLPRRRIGVIDGMARASAATTQPSWANSALQAAHPAARCASNSTNSSCCIAPVA